MRLKLNRRGWFYLITLVVVGGLYLWYAVATHQIDSNSNKAQAASLDEQTVAWQGYLAKQTDPFKLVSLLKKITYADPKILELVTLRAYELAPNNRDITILASYFRPELKDKVLQLDPLYSPSSK